MGFILSGVGRHARHAMRLGILPLALVSVSLLVPACRKREVPVAAPIGPVASVKSPLLLPEGYPPGSVQAPGPVALKTQLNDALHSFIEMRGGFPTNINDLTFTKMIPAVPPAPPGKKYVIDAKKLEVLLTNL